MLQQVDVALPSDRKSKPSGALIAMTSTFLALLVGLDELRADAPIFGLVTRAEPDARQARTELFKARRLRG